MSVSEPVFSPVAIAGAWDQADREALDRKVRRFSAWFLKSALPVWATAGRSPDGRVFDALAEGLVPSPRLREMRVQARQVFVYAEAGRLGWSGPWREIALGALATLERDHLRPDGLYRTRLTADGSPLDEAPRLYDHAFLLLALSSCHGAGLILDAECRAVALRNRLEAEFAAGTGLRETGERPYQANALMHLLEACQAWIAARGDPGWMRLGSRVVALCVDHLVQAETLLEFFDADWRPSEDARVLVEPGHQFEWATLLSVHHKQTGDVRAGAVARALFDSGARGLAGRPATAMDTMNDQGVLQTDIARLWPQTEGGQPGYRGKRGVRVERSGHAGFTSECLRRVERTLLPRSAGLRRCGRRNRQMVYQALTGSISPSPGVKASSVFPG